MDLVETMLPVAQEMEVKLERATFRATAAGASTLFSKEAGEAYDAALAAIVKDIRAEQTESVPTKQDLQTEAADAILGFFGNSPHMKNTGASKQKPGVKRGR